MESPIDGPDIDRPGILDRDSGKDMKPDGERVPDRDDLPDAKSALKTALGAASGVAEAGRVIDVDKNDDDNLVVDVVLTKKNYKGNIPHEQIARARALITAKAENPLWISLSDAVKGEGLKRLTNVKQIDKLGDRQMFVSQVTGVDIPDPLQTGEYMYRVEVLGRKLGPYEEE
jgi:hypothetical protein